MVYTLLDYLRIAEQFLRDEYQDDKPLTEAERTYVGDNYRQPWAYPLGIAWDIAGMRHQEQEDPWTAQHRRAREEEALT